MIVYPEMPLKSPVPNRLLVGRVSQNTRTCILKGHRYHRESDKTEDFIKEIVKNKMRIIVGHKSNIQLFNVIFALFMRFIFLSWFHDYSAKKVFFKLKMS